MLPDLFDTQLFVAKNVEFFIDEKQVEVLVFANWFVIDHGVEQADLHLRRPYHT